MPHVTLTLKKSAVRCWILCAGLALVATATMANTSKTSCSTSLDAVVGRFLDRPNLVSPKDRGRTREELSPVEQSVCQRYLGKPHLWQVVYVLARNESSQRDPSFDLVIALVDMRLRHVVAITTEELLPDAMYDEHSPLSFGKPLGLQGTDLQLLRDPSGRGARCAEGYLGTQSSVYVARGKKLVPVITDIFLLHEWRAGVCSQNEVVTIQETRRSLQKATKIRNGLPDVYLNVTVRDFNEKTGRPLQTRRTKFLLNYNGERYESSKKVSDLEYCWLEPSKTFCKKNTNSTKK
jgi:hypothetical protein